MKSKTVYHAVVPMLLISTGTLGYLAITKHWNFEIVSYSIFLFTLIYILIFERLLPLKQAWIPQRNSFWEDMKHLFFSTALFDALGKMLALSLVIYSQKHLFTIAGIWDTFPLLTQYVVASLIGDFLPYLYHRVSHKGHTNSYLSLLLWKIHAIHHLPVSMNWFKTNWIHPVNMTLNVLLKLTPLLLLGFGEEIIFLTGITHVVIAYISHANIRTAKSFLDYLIVTPRIHHFHHSTKMEEAKNFGNTFPFWDIIFGTYYNRTGDVEQVGVVKNSGIKYPEHRSFFRQMLFPTGISKDCCPTK